MKKILFSLLLVAVVAVLYTSVDAYINISGLGPAFKGPHPACNPIIDGCNIYGPLNTGSDLQRKFGTLTIGAPNWVSLSHSEYDALGLESIFGVETQNDINAFSLNGYGGNIFDSLRLEYLAQSQTIQGNTGDVDEPINSTIIPRLLCIGYLGHVSPCSAATIFGYKQIQTLPNSSNTLPSATITANPSITDNTTTLSWNSTKADFCEAISGEGFALDTTPRTSSGSITITVTKNMSYTIACYNNTTNEFALATTSVFKTGQPSNEVILTHGNSPLNLGLTQVQNIACNQEPCVELKPALTDLDVEYSVTNATYCSISGHLDNYNAGYPIGFQNGTVWKFSPDPIPVNGNNPKSVGFNTYTQWIQTQEMFYDGESFGMNIKITCSNPTSSKTIYIPVTVTVNNNVSQGTAWTFISCINKNIQDPSCLWYPTKSSACSAPTVLDLYTTEKHYMLLDVGDFIWQDANKQYPLWLFNGSGGQKYSWIAAVNNSIQPVVKRAFKISNIDMLINGNIKTVTQIIETSTPC